MKTIIIIALSFFVGYIIGKIREYLQNRWQCPDCGSFKTNAISSGHGGVKGGKYNYAVRHWEGHICRNCGTMMSITMEKIQE